MPSCPLCKKELKQMNSTHLKLHSITSEEFRKQYPEFSFGNETSAKIRREAKMLRERQYLLNPIKCVHCTRIIPYNQCANKKSDAKRQKAKNKTGNIFCSASCAATYNNTHKKHGCRKSKLEFYLEEKLIQLYPHLEIHFNRKDAINSELDIYIPSLKLGFELNGIYHYEPIHGDQKLSQIQNNDKRKFQACLERGIELCIIDTSKMKYFKNSNAEPFLNIIRKIITQKQFVFV